MRRIRSNNFLFGSAFICTLILVIGSFLAWLEHVITTIQNHDYILLIIGAFIPPIGVIHGIGLWLGWFTS